jgi:hypothetical protein
MTLETYEKQKFLGKMLCDFSLSELSKLLRNYRKYEVQCLFWIMEKMS